MQILQRTKLLMSSTWAWNVWRSLERVSRSIARTARCTQHLLTWEKGLTYRRGSYGATSCLCKGSHHKTEMASRRDCSTDDIDSAGLNAVAVNKRRRSTNYQRRSFSVNDGDVSGGYWLSFEVGRRKSPGRECKDGSAALDL